MSETLNFGPEWLRALSTGAGVSSPPPSPGVAQFKLAEHRYGREEMLALFRKTEKLPPELIDFHSVVRKDCQSPMSLMPLTDEEQRSLSQCVNSTVAIRATGRGGGGTVPPTRGRGVSRGRGRGRVEYQRSMTYEEEGGFPRREYNRTMSWDESVHEPLRFEKPHRPERSFEEDPPASPRKIIERDRGSASENWRNPRAEREWSSSRFEEEDGGSAWRRAVGGRPGRIAREGDESWRNSQGTSRSSWHNPRERTHSQSEQDDRDGVLREYDRDRGSRERHFSGRGRYSSLTDEAPEEVPEWTLDDEAFDDDEIGVFDASGAFTAVKKSDLEKEEREQEMKEKNKLEADGNFESSKATKEELLLRNSEDSSIVQFEPNFSKPTGGTFESSSSSKTVNGNAGTDIRTTNHSHLVPALDTLKTEDAPSVSNTLLPTPNKDDPLDVLSRGFNSAALNTNLAKESHVDQIKTHMSISESLGMFSDKGSEKKEVVSPPAPKPQEVDVSREDEEDQLQHLEKAAEDLMAELITEEDEKIGDEINEPIESQLIPTPKMPPEEDTPVHALPASHENAQKWFYKDPQGQIQGPFTSAEMMEWFRAGYFTMSLQVKRGVDEDFHPLGILIKRWNRVPFLTNPPPTSPVPPQMMAPTPTSATPPVQPQPPSDLMQPQTQLTEQQQWQKLAEVRQVLAQKKQQQLLQQQQHQQQQHAFQTLLHQQQSLIRVQATRIYQELSQRGKSLTIAQQQVLRQQLMTLQQQHHMLIQQQQNWHRVQQALTTTQPVTSPLPQTRVVPKTTVSKEMGPGGVEEMQISVWDPVPTERSRREWDIGVWDPEMAKDISEEERAKRLKEEAIKRKVEEAQEKILREQEEKMREEERRKIEDLQAKRIEEELRRHAEEEQRILEEMRNQETKMVQEEEVRQAAVAAAADDNGKTSKERSSPIEKQMQEEMKKLDELKKLEESHQKKKEDMERQRKEEEVRKKEEERLKQEATLKMQQEAAAARKVKEEQERARLEERDREAERQKMLRQQESQRQQQQEAMRRMQQQQVPPQPQTPVLPSSAMWAQQSLSPTPTSNTPTLAQIQQMQQQQEERDRQERQRQLQLIHQQQQQQQQQQAMQSRSTPWGSSQRVTHSVGQTKSLREIQEEQARQHLERQRQSKAAPSINLNPVVASGAWGSNNSNHHLAWGNNNTSPGLWGDHSGSRSAPVTSSSSMGFWDDAQEAISRTSTSVANNTNFPPPRAQPPTSMAQRQQVPNMKSRMAKEEENVHRLFQTPVPSNEFSQWCEMALQGMGASVDIPTFIAFLQDVDSPYEVHDYVKTYLGETRESTDFGRQFLERRARYKEQQRKRSEQMGVWMTAGKGSTGGMGMMGHPAAVTASMSEWEAEANRRSSKAKKKNRMQPVDPSILGFSVNAAERINIGEIQTIEDM